jgi:hypothetical protein
MFSAANLFKPAFPNGLMKFLREVMPNFFMGSLVGVGAILALISKFLPKPRRQKPVKIEPLLSAIRRQQAALIQPRPGVGYG